MDYSGKKVVVMGLGLHGGGLETARFLLKRGASLTITDIRDEKTLLPSIERLDASCRELKGESVRYVLGKHEMEDFKNADIVIKNPGVKPDSPFLLASKNIETDISLFLSESKARLFAVTGSKGKSCTATALHRILDRAGNYGKAYLGGNITVSPLTFLDELSENDDVVLELSSWQLGDLKGRVSDDGNPLLKPKAAILTAIMPDHLDRYASMEEYVDDKRNIYRGQDESCVTVAGDDEWGKSFLSESKGRPLVYSGSADCFALAVNQSGGWIDSDGRGMALLRGWPLCDNKITELVPAILRTPGNHQKLNLLAASLAAYSLGMEAEKIRGVLAEFPGIEHRLELFHEAKGIRFYNDSAATIPEAAAACVEALSLQGSLVLVTGGTDKNLNFTPLARTAVKAKEVILLAGTGSEKLIPLLGEEGINYRGPFDNLDKAVLCALEKAKEGGIIALSPGCASFGMFLNEFDRGRQWKETVLKLT
ncbi:MAG: UDP-N-acetylmuramoyl-L-alanine--D-glutamate ligase [Treponema sp.]|nr:UDP-N-acetylmuramoyl-L-alanine--D-glutamate ligase [Treponema sp.]